MTPERRYAIQGRKDWEAMRIAHAVANMRTNKAYRYAVERAGGDPDGRLLQDFNDRFSAYREGWRGYPRRAIEAGLHDQYVRATHKPPPSGRIQGATGCELACPLLYRQHNATPDKPLD